MRFGAFTPQGWTHDLVGINTEDHWETMLGVAKTLESNGFESVWVFDHLHTVPIPTQEPTYEAWTLMAALAASTDTIRLGQMCTCNSYRPPAHLAHVAASIDAISGGRLDIGIGAGWYKHEYLAHGYEFPKPSVRIGQLAEGVEVMKRMWTEDEASFEGEYYRIDGAICRPKPIQQPHIPFWIAGGGERLTLNVAARYASYTNFANADPEDFAHKSEVLRNHCEAEGTDFHAITRSTNMRLICAESEAEANRRIDEIAARIRTVTGEAEGVDRMVEGAKRQSGPPDKLIERIRKLKEVGMSYLIIHFPDAAYDDSSMELFAREVIPALS